MALSSILLAIFLCAPILLLVIPQVTGDVSASVGSIHTNGSTIATCHGTLIAPRVVLTTASCLYDHDTRTPRQKIQFSLNNQKVTTYDILISPEWLRTGRHQENWGVLILPRGATANRLPITWSPNAIEDMGVQMATPSVDYPCTSAQGGGWFSTMKRVDTDFIAFTCSGVPTNPLSGAAIYTQHDGDAVMFGVYSQECVSGWGPISKKDAHCAVRIGASAFRIICDEASKLGYTMQECSNPVLQVPDISQPTVIDTADSYSALSKTPPSLGLILVYCQKRVCSGTSSCQECSLCDMKQMDNFASLGQMKTFHNRYIVRTVVLGDVLRVQEVTHVPTVLVRRPGEFKFRQYKGYIRNLVNELEEDSTRTKRESGDENPTKDTEVHGPSRNRRMVGDSDQHWGNKTMPLPPLTTQQTVQWCNIANKFRRNVWKNDCTLTGSQIFVTPTRKLSWLGQSSYREITLLKATIRCEGKDKVKVMCRDGDAKAVDNLRQYISNLDDGVAHGASGSGCEIWMTITSLPSPANEDSMQQLLKSLRERLNVTTTRLAFSNLSPTLRFDDDCTTRDDANASVSALRKLTETGVTLAQCRFPLNWWAKFLIFAGPKHADLKSERDQQTRCERELIENEALAVGGKDDCLYPDTYDGDSPDFIGVTWTGG